MNILSIDFGTSFCTAAFLDDKGEPRAVCFGNNQYNNQCLKLPTVIQYALTASGEECKIVGESALTNLVQSNHLNSSIVSKIKTELRGRTGYVINGKIKESVDIVADILSTIKERAEKDAGRTFTDLILTHPAKYEFLKRELLVDAAKKSGFTTTRLLEEPVAAAHAFIRKHRIPERKGAIVFDYGGGTIDLVYLWLENPETVEFRIEPVSAARCGGEYIDLELHNHLRPALGIPDSPHTLPILLEHCNRMKINFGQEDEQLLMYNQKAKRLSLEEFERIIAPKVDAALDLLRQMVQRCDECQYPIDYIFLNGGSSRLKVVERTIRTTLPNAEILTFGGDDLAVAIGALLSVKREDNAQRVRISDPNLDKIREQFRKSNS